METWNIKGKRFTDGPAWTMNPNGYVESRTERGDKILAAANRVRTDLLLHLEKFFILLEAAKTVPEKCLAVYSYFTDIGLEDKLLEIAKKEQNNGNTDSAAQYSAVYGVLLNALADIADALSGEEADTEEFYAILRAVFDKTQIGTIPTSVDQVMIGSAATVRASNPKYTFVIGLCEGEFPATVNERGIFTPADRAKLKQMEIELSTDNDARSSDELMFVSKAFSTPSHGLYLFTEASNFDGSSKTASIPFRRVEALLDKYEPHVYSGDDIQYLVGAPRSAAAHIRTIGNTPEGMALMAAVSEYLPNAAELSQRSVSASEDLHLSEATVRAVHGDTAKFSATTFEGYVSCPMSYYCSNVLKLREKVDDDFIASDMGNFVHAILEELIKYATQAKDGILPTDDEIMRHTEEATLRYIDKISPSELKRSKRLNHIYKKLEALSKLMVKNIVEEFASSEFFPAFFELSIGKKNGDMPPMVFKLEDESTVKFEGKIDRVDLYRNDDGLFVRIVDYKTGSKVFSLDDVSRGINTQMLLYLFMLCKDGASAFCNKLGLEETKLNPAGIMYVSADIPVIPLEAEDSMEVVLKKAEGKIHRSGLLLNQPEIISAMNKDLSSRFLAGVRKNSDTGVMMGDALTSPKEFDRLYNEISDTVKEIIQKLRRGHAGASPLRYDGRNPCDYCKMKPVCRRES